jgi:hypothetical protein
VVKFIENTPLVPRGKKKVEIRGINLGFLGINELILMDFEIM